MASTPLHNICQKLLGPCAPGKRHPIPTIAIGSSSCSGPDSIFRPIFSGSVLEVMGTLCGSCPFSPLASLCCFSVHAATDRAFESCSDAQRCLCSAVILETTTSCTARVVATGYRVVPRVVALENLPTPQRAPTRCCSSLGTRSPTSFQPCGLLLRAGQLECSSFSNVVSRVFSSTRSHVMCYLSRDSGGGG